MASNTQGINEIEKRLGELNAFEERIKGFVSEKEGINLVAVQQKVQGLEGAIEPLVQRMSAFEQVRGGITSSSSLPRADGHVEELEALVNDLQ